MQKEEKESPHNKVAILSLKNQKAFDKANRAGVKNHSKSMILITYFDKSGGNIPQCDITSPQEILTKNLSHPEFISGSREILKKLTDDQKTHEIAAKTPFPRNDDMVNNYHEQIPPESKIQIHLGLKISKKIGKAVIRNKIRRRIKAIMHELPENLAASSIHNRVIVIIPKRGMEKLPYQSLKQEIVRVLTSSK